MRSGCKSGRFDESFETDTQIPVGLSRAVAMIFISRIALCEDKQRPINADGPENAAVPG
jgi:hypothetical protein